jgi:hypothetical protein
MTQPSRTTESISRDNEAIREIMHRVRELTVPDRATLAVGLVGHLATLMNRRQMAKLLGELKEEAERVQDVPPARQRDMPRDDAGGERSGTAADGQGLTARSHGPDDRSHSGDADRARDPVGQEGRGEFRSGRLL